MKKIIDVSTKKEIKFIKEDFPMLVHGKNHSGASLFSVTIAALLHSNGNKLLIFTAYPMAREEFLKQIKNIDTVFYLEDEKNINQALGFQTIIIQSGNIDLFINVISNYDMEDRIIFIKNIETISIPILQLVSPYLFIISGELDSNKLQKDFTNFAYKTKIFTSPMFNEKIPPLEKYQAFMKNRLGDTIVVVN